jgi:mRNA-degrading endonuclease toxin of MazEF toxin-antitoxin module
VPLPEPRPGLVIRYDYLWSREAVAGRDQGKERPACLVAATDSAAAPRFVVILPITHTPPDKGPSECRFQRRSATLSAWTTHPAG